MNKQEAAAFLFSIAKEIKRSFESPVILINKKDYAANIHNLLIEMRQSLIDNAPPEQIVETVVGFHLEWLQAVRDLRGLKAKVKDTPREVFWSAIDYTIECVKSRYVYFHRYIQHLQESLTENDRNLMQAEIELIQEMQSSVLVVLEEKRHCLQHQSDTAEFIVKVEYEIEELMNWLDRLNDNLVVQLCKVVAKQDPSLLAELSDTLKDIVEEVTEGPASNSLLSILKSYPTSRQYMLRMSASHDLEIKKVRDKIKILEDRIQRLEGQCSAATMALRHKKIYLEERLRSLENLKESLHKITEDNVSTSDIAFLDSVKEVHIFNHWLPIYGRYRLVEELVNLWKTAIHGAGNRKSVISILSVADFKEIYDDELGHYFIDKHGRKLYEKDNDGNLYQVNEHNVLVPLNDTEQHVFFYDNCGRYYIGASDQRVYQMHEGASEYIMHPLGYMLKHKEIVDGVTFWFDKLGRYYLNEDSRRIYLESGETEEYVNDGFGNLIPLRAEMQQYCSHEPTYKPMISKESLYLKRNVGDALKHCIRSATLSQPADPIGYLANELEQYWRNAQARCEHQREDEELKAERARLADLRPEKLEPPSVSEPKQESGEGSFGYSDSNFVLYHTKRMAAEDD